MPLRNAHPIRFQAMGVCDSLDPTEAVQGAMASLANMIPDPTTKGVFQCRPASVVLPNSAGTTPATASIVVGNYLFLMGSPGNGRDFPYGYDLVNKVQFPSALTLSGATSSNTPFTQPTTGTWEPPTMVVVGSKILVTHPGFAGTGFFFGVIDISTPSAPTWTAFINTTTNTLASRPVAVAQFNNRAYWLVNPVGSTSGVYASDVLAPTTITNLNIINFDDLTPCTAMAGMPLNNQLGGVVQSLMVFKGVSNIYQIQGDPALSNWSRNTLNVATGTLAPRSVVITPEGLAFIAPDGMRTISFTGQVGPPIGEGGLGVVVPFENSAEPTRISAAANSSVYRVSVKLSSGWAEYWYDLRRQLWTGPHTCAFTDLNLYNNTFIGIPTYNTSALAQSDYLQSVTSSFTENGVALSWTWQTAVLPDTEHMAECSMVETTLHMALGTNAGSPPLASCYALDQDGTQLGSFAVTAIGPIWGTAVWGNFIWGGGASNLKPRQLKWSMPVTFRRLAIQVTGPSASNVKVGDLYLRYQELGYLQQ